MFLTDLDVNIVVVVAVAIPICILKDTSLVLMQCCLLGERTSDNEISFSIVSEPNSICFAFK